MKSFVKKSRAGITLIEVIITIAILGIVIVSVTQFLTFNLRTFTKGEKVAEVQFDVRMASDFISNELRNVTNLSGGIITDGNRIDLTNLKTRFNSLTDVKFAILRENNRILVNYVIIGNSSDGKNLFRVESKVLLNNDRLFKTGLPEASNLNTIYYKS